MKINRHPIYCSLFLFTMVEGLFPGDHNFVGFPGPVAAVLRADKSAGLSYRAVTLPRSEGNSEHSKSY